MFVSPAAVQAIDRGNTQTDLYELQIIASDGILPQKITLNHYCDYLEIVGDSVYILDTDNIVQFYVYRIEEQYGLGLEHETLAGMQAYI